MLTKRDADLQTESIDHVASIHGIPLFEVRRPLQDEFATAIRKFSPELIVASCFPWRIPRMVRAEATHGGMNLHPSLLPLHRGPDPIFWTYLAGERVTGTTVHEITDDFDAGVIYGQSEAEISDDMPGDQLEARLADVGANLLVDAIDRLETDRFEARAQDETRASYQSWPSRRELEIDRSWTIQHTLNFVAGVIPLGYEPWVTTDRGSVQVDAARKIDSNPTSLTESWPDDQSVVIAVADGMVELKISE